MTEQDGWELTTLAQPDSGGTSGILFCEVPGPGVRTSQNVVMPC